jgi:hypothetical protein
MLKLFSGFRMIGAWRRERKECNIYIYIYNIKNDKKCTWKYQMFVAHGFGFDYKVSSLIARKPWLQVGTSRLE